jgi:predicted transglutaminase-like cysteine proteinase
MVPQNNFTRVGLRQVMLVLAMATLSGCFSKKSPTESLQLSGDRTAQEQPVIVRPNRFPDVDMQTTSSINSSFFETTAIPFANLTTKDNWDRVRKTGFDELGPGCGMGACGQRFRQLSNTIDAIEDKPFFEKLEAVNSTVNSVITYTPDSQLYVKNDHWATTNQTIETGRGACEDIAILKHSVLLKAGIPASSMSLVVLKDTSRNLYHAVLAVSTNSGHLILDNVSNNIYRDTSVHHYQPLYSFSDDRSWIHGVDEKSKGFVLANTADSLSSIAPGESVFLKPSEPHSNLNRTEDIYPVSPIDINSEPG